MTTEDAVKLIRGKVGTKVVLELRRGAGEFVTVDLIRDRIELAAVDSSVNVAPNGTKVGYIRLKQFNANAAKDMRNAITELSGEGVSGFVLDLRSNPGGLLMASVEIARQWLDDGVIVSSSTRDGVSDVKRARFTSLTPCLLYTSPSPRDYAASRMPSSA